MIRFTCPGCDKKLGIPETLAGRVAACPQCKHKFRIPHADAPEAEEEVGEELVAIAPRPAASPKKRPVAEDERKAKAPGGPVEDDDAEEAPAESQEAGQEDEAAPALVRKKKKRLRRRPMKSEPGAGRVLVIIVCAVVLGMYVLSMLSWLAAPDPVEMAKQQAREVYQKIGKDLPKDFEQKQEQELDKAMQGIREARRPWQIIGLVWMLVSFCVSAALLTFLFLRYNWARLVLGVFSLIGAGLGFLGIYGSVAALAFYPTSATILAVLEVFIRLAADLGIGLLLILSPSIVAYTRR